MRKLTLRDYMIRLGVLIGAILLITWFLPREKTAEYDFSLGRPWKYSQLIASFDFPIRKSNEVVKQERDSVARTFQPYYNLDPNAEQQETEALEGAFLDGTLHDLPQAYLNHIKECLHEIYSRGIINIEDIHALSDSSITAIKIVNENEAVSRPLKDIFSTRTAYEYLLHADTTNFPPETLYRCNLNEYICANLSYDKERSENMKRDLLASVSYASGLVQSGEQIIDRGEIVTPRAYNILKSLEKETHERNESEQETHTKFFGQFLYVGMLLSTFFFYLVLFRKDYFDKGNSILLMLFMLMLFPIATSFLIPGRPLVQYIMPIAMVGIFVRIFMDTRTAFMCLIITLLITACIVPDPYEFLAVQFVAGMVSIYSLRELTQRSQLIKTAVVATVSAAAMALAFDLFQGTEFSRIDPPIYIHIFFNGILLLFTYPLLFVVEKTFGFTSDVTLIELSNINNQLLREMSKKAQGTFNHSLQVSNLAAEVANKIGAKTQLVRTGALYHDIGKMKNAAFFTENQHGRNPHDGLPEEKSAAIIISHVTEGLKMAEKYSLPKDIRAFIATHHGRSKVQYFYVTYRNKHSDETNIDETAFTYPGPNPFTREQAILMMADSVEAASRSLKEYTEESIRELVNRIIDKQMSSGYYTNCPITFKDISIAKEVFIESLKTIYHTRISYPELNKTDDTEQQPQHTLGNFIITGLHRNKS